MKFWKVLGGVTIGIGAVAAAPFTGGGSVLGAATLLGSLAGAAGTAAVAGAVGGVIGANLTEEEKRRQKRPRTHNRVENKKTHIKKRKPVNIFTVLSIKNQIEKEELIIMLTEFGVAIANSDGVFEKKELLEIKKFNNLIHSSNSLSINTKNRVDEILMSKRDLTHFKKSFKKFILTKNNEFVNKIIKILDNVLEKIINADGVIKEEEKKIKNEWQKFSLEIRKRKPKPNIILVGASGVGKSSMINLILGKEIAPTGVGKPLTKGINTYGDDNSIVNLFDTEGFEISKEVYFKKLIHSILNNKNEKVHAILHVISASSNRITDYDKKLNTMLRTFNIPVGEVYSKIDEVSEDDVEPMITQLFDNLSVVEALKSSIPPFFSTTEEELYRDNLDINIDKVISWTYNQI